MKTYEFDIWGSAEPVHVVVTHGDDGSFRGVDMGGYDPEYDIAFAAMGGDSSDAPILYDVLTNFDTTQKEDVVLGIRRMGLSGLGKTIVALSVDQDFRCRLAEEFIGQGIYLVSKPERHDFVRVLIGSIMDQNLLTRILCKDGQLDFEVFAETYRRLDDVHREQVAAHLPLFRFSLYDLKTLALGSSKHARLSFVSRIVQHPHGFQLGGAGYLDAVRISIDIAESIEDEFVRTGALVVILSYLKSTIKRRQAERIGTILLATDPGVLGGFADAILGAINVFPDSQMGRLFTRLSKLR
jgi:hypothetical protein